MNKKSLFLLLCLLCLLLTACGGAGAGVTAASAAETGGTAGTQGTTEPSPGTHPGTQGTIEPSPGTHPDMARVCLYCEYEDEAFEHDLAIIRERVAAFSGGKYAFARSKIPVVYGDGQAEGTEYPAIEFYIPMEIFKTRLPNDTIRFLVSRPVDLWISENEGTGDKSKYTEMLPLRREDIQSVRVVEGCPPGINPFDYAIDAQTFPYLEVTLSEAFYKNNPQISSWKRPSFLHDVENYEQYFHTEGVAAGDGRTIYLLGFSKVYEDDSFDEGRRCLDTLAYDYTHEPLTQGFYIYDIPGTAWETPDAGSESYQIGPDAFTKPSTVYTLELEEEICSDENWQAAIQTIKERLDILQVHYAIGQAGREKRTLMVRVECSKAIDDMVGYLIMRNPDLILSMCGKELSFKGGDARAAVVEKDGRYVLSLDFSETRRDILNHLTSLAEDADGDRLLLSIGSRYDPFPVLWTDCSEVIRDGKVTLEVNAFSGKMGFSSEDLPFLNFTAALINGSLLPEDDDGQLVTLEAMDFADLDAAGNFCLIKGDDLAFDYNGYFEKLQAKAAAFDPVVADASSNNDNAGPNCFIARFNMPSGKDQTAQITETVSQLIQAFRDDIFGLGVRFDWIDGDDEIRVLCTGSYDAPGMASMWITGYGSVTQEALDALAESLKNDKRLGDKILIDLVATAD